MDPTPSLWEGILQRASALRQRYGNLADAPQDTWSLVNRVAAEKFQGQVVPDTNDRDHLYGLWTKAMYCVLNDLHRKEQRRDDRNPGERIPLSDELAVTREEDGALKALEEALHELVRRDEKMGEQKGMLVALKYIEGLSWEELATTLGSSVRRARDEWAVTRAWLRRELKRRGFDLDG